MSTPELRRAAEASNAAERARAGLPEKVGNPVVLGTIATILASTAPSRRKAA